MEVVRAENARFAKFNPCGFFVDIPNKFGAVKFIVGPLEKGIVLFAELKLSVLFCFFDGFCIDMDSVIFKTHGIKMLRTPGDEVFESGVFNWLRSLDNPGFTLVEKNESDM